MPRARFEQFDAFSASHIRRLRGSNHHVMSFPLRRPATAHFRILSDTTPDAVLRAVAARLQADLPRFQADLGVPSMRTVDVRVWQEEAAWYGL